MTDLFNQKEGEQLRDQGIALMEGGKGKDWLETARSRLYQHCKSGAGIEVTSDDVHRLTPKPAHLHNNILGAVFRDRRWKATGEWRPTKRPEGHARRVAVYKLAEED